MEYVKSKHLFEMVCWTRCETDIFTRSKNFTFVTQTTHIL